MEEAGDIFKLDQEIAAVLRFMGPRSAPRSSLGLVQRCSNILDPRSQRIFLTLMDATGASELPVHELLMLVCFPGAGGEFCKTLRDSLWAASTATR